MLFPERSKYLRGLLNIITCPADKGSEFKNAWKNLPGVLGIDYMVVDAVDWPAEAISLHLSRSLPLETGSAPTQGGWVSAAGLPLMQFCSTTGRSCKHTRD